MQFSVLKFIELFTQKSNSRVCLKIKWILTHQEIHVLTTPSGYRASIIVRTKGKKRGSVSQTFIEHSLLRTLVLDTSEETLNDRIPTPVHHCSWREGSGACKVSFFVFIFTIFSQSDFSSGVYTPTFVTLISSDNLLPSNQPIFIFLEIGSLFVAQACLELLASRNPTTSASQRAGIKGVSHCAWPVLNFLSPRSQVATLDFTERPSLSKTPPSWRVICPLFQRGWDRASNEVISVHQPSLSLRKRPFHPWAN